MNISILVIDNDNANLDCVSKKLSLLGYAVYCAPGSSQAVEWLRTHKVDLVIADCRTGNMNGGRLLDLILNGNPGRIPIILMNDKRDSYLRMGFDGFLQKPFTMNELYSEVERVRLLIGN
jgi:CheY-like chemotaxis protein